LATRGSAFYQRGLIGQGSRIAFDTRKSSVIAGALPSRIDIAAAHAAWLVQTELREQVGPEPPSVALLDAR